MDAACLQCRRLLSAQQDGDTDQNEDNFIQQHVADCDDCQAVQASYKLIRNSVRTLTHPAPPAQLRTAVMTRVRNERKTVGRSGFNWGQRFVLAGIAIMVLAFGSFIVLGILRNDPFRVDGNPIADVGQQKVIVSFNRAVDRNYTYANAASLFEITDGQGRELTMDYNGTQVVGSQVQLAVKQEVNLLTNSSNIQVLVQPEVRDSNGARLDNPGPKKATIVTPIPFTSTPVPTTIAPTTTDAPATVTPVPTTAIATATSTTVAANTPTPTSNVPNIPPPTNAPLPTATFTNRPIPTTRPANTIVVPVNTPVVPTVRPNTPTVPIGTSTAVPTPTTVTATPTVVIPTATVTPTLTIAPTPTVTPTLTIAPTPTVVVPTPTITPTATAVPPTPTVNIPAPVKCNVTPIRGFGKLYQEHPEIAKKIGCATADETQATIAYQVFERGFMFWHKYGNGKSGWLYVFYNNGTWLRFADPGDPVPTTPVPTATPTPTTSCSSVPVSGFGYVWATNPTVRQNIGCPLTIEIGSEGGAYEPFDKGHMLFNPIGVSGERVYAIYNDGTFVDILNTFED